MSKKGKLYGVGVGPGDPELLTLKAVRILQEADIIAAPDTGSGEQTALSIVRSYITRKQVLSCYTPMTRDRAVLDDAYRTITESICAYLENSSNVAYITLGDPSIYSTYMNIHRLVLEQGYPVETIPGVPSFCTAASLLGKSLCEGNERLLIVPASHELTADCFTTDANLVFMKAGRNLYTLRQALDTHGLLADASLVANCGMPNEQIWEHFADAPENSSYFSVVVVKRQ